MKILAMLAIGLFIGFSVAQAQTVADEKGKTQSTTESTKGKFVDANKNGVCDNFEARKSNVNGKGAGFVDANKDGICDHRVNSGNGNCCGNKHRHSNGYGRGNGNGNGNGNGQGCRYRNGQSDN